MNKKNVLIFTICFVLIFSPFVLPIQTFAKRDYTPLYVHLTWQRDPKTTMTVSWYTADVTDSAVQYGLDDTYGNEETDTSEVYWHHVELTGLTPDTVYHYRVGNGKTWGFDYHFKTATAEKHTKFLNFGDSQSDTDGRKQVLRAIERLSMDMILYSGDFVENSGNMPEWYSWFSSFARVNIFTPLIPTMGNHEKNISIYYNVFALPGGEEYYSLDYGPVHVSVLHTYYEGYDNHGNYDNQAAWLISDLEANQDAEWQIVMMHRPPFSSYPRNFEDGNWYVQINETFVPIFESYNVSFVLLGHEHGYERLLKNDVNYIIAAGGGSRLYNVNPSQILDESQKIEKTFNFVFFEVDENKIHARAYRPDYSFIDEVYINRENKSDLSFVTLPLTYKDYWNESSNLEMSVMVANTGEQNITTETELKLEIYENPSSYRDYVPMPVIENYEIPPLDIGENYTLNFDWPAEVPTTYSYTFTLDNLEEVDEVTEGNNELVIYQIAKEEPEETNFIAEGIAGFLLVLSFLLVPTLIKKRSRKN